MISVSSLEVLFAQESDTMYIRQYPQKMWIAGYTSFNMIEIENEKRTYSPNFPVNAGIGLGIRNTVIDFLAGYSIVPLKGKEYGKTKVTDWQIHHYGRRFLIDLYYQKYTGFFQETKDEIMLYPDLSVQQIGAEGTYIFNSNKFSAKAPFGQTEQQILSAGSYLLGSGIYWHKLRPGTLMKTEDNTAFENLQLGLNFGYAYSWVIDEKWLVSGMATVGANFGNEQKALKENRIKVYPTAFARFSTVYKKKDWSVSFAMLINHKSVYSAVGSPFALNSFNLQITYVKQLQRIFGKKR